VSEGFARSLPRTGSFQCLEGFSQKLLISLEDLKVLSWRWEEKGPTGCFVASNWHDDARFAAVCSAFTAMTAGMCHGPSHTSTATGPGVNGSQM
jgi:hypothetical protein